MKSTLKSPLNSLLVAAAILAAFAATAHADEAQDMFTLKKAEKMDLASPLGYWSLPDQSRNGFIFSMRFRMKDTEVTVANRCIYGGQTAYVAATAPITLTDSFIQINGSARNSVNVGGLTCNVSIDAGAPQRYRVVNGVLTIENTAVTADKLQDL